MFRNQANRRTASCYEKNFSKEFQGVRMSANAANTSVRATRSARTLACRVATHGDS